MSINYFFFFFSFRPRQCCLKYKRESKAKKGGKYLGMGGL